MTYESPGSSGEGEKKIRLFVYGTLRKEGLSAHLMKNHTLIKANVRIPGFAMYDAGWYPFIIPSPKEGAFVVGDLYEVLLKELPALDQYEGPEYKRMLLPDGESLVYVKKDSDVEEFSLVEEGDWLKYWKKKSTGGAG